MVRTPCYDKNGVKKGAWCQEEDDKLRAYIQRYGHWNWSELPKFAGLSRCGKSCRLRWMNYLRPNVKRGNYTQEEDDLIIKLHKELGNKWCMIAAKLPGRTDNEIKNHWHTSLKKRAKQNTTTSCEEKDVVHETVLTPKILESSQLSLEHSSSEASSSSSILSSDNYAPAPSTINLAKEDSNPVAASSDSFFELNDDFWTEPFLADTYQDDFPLTLAEGGFIFPYISYGEDVEDLLYKIMQEFPEEY